MGPPVPGAAAAAADELAAALTAYRGLEASAAEAAAPRQAYTEAAYWERRFQETDGIFDWYATFQELEPLFQEHCPPTQDPEVLMVGCGNSGLSADMHKAGYRRIVNIDIAAAAVEKMKQRCHDLGLEWLVMDATALEFEAGRFDLAVDKGTADAMLHSPCAGGTAEAMVAEVWRILRPGGLFLLVSHSAARQEVLQRAVTEQSDDEGGWELVESRVCRLSPQATVINILRSKLGGRPISEALRDAALLQEATEEARDALRKMAFLEAFRLFKARKAGSPPQRGEWPSPEPAGTEGSESDDDGTAAAGGGGGATRDPRRQPFCWAYVLRKPRSGGAAAAGAAR